MAITPTREVLQNGTFANDGTGDTLRDAATKINNNFTKLWEDTYDGVGVRPGREFLCNGINGSDPDSGGVTILNDSLGVDSQQILRVSRWDQEEKSFKTSVTSAFQPVNLSMWKLDSGTLDEWNLVALYKGSVQYVTANDYWRFTKDSTLASYGQVDSGDTLYIKLDGVW